MSPPLSLSVLALRDEAREERGCILLGDMRERKTRYLDLQVRSRGKFKSLVRCPADVLLRHLGAFVRVRSVFCLLCVPSIYLSLSAVPLRLAELTFFLDSPVSHLLRCPFDPHRRRS